MVETEKLPKSIRRVPSILSVKNFSNPYETLLTSVINDIN